MSQPPAGSQGPYQAPKKKHTGRNVAFIIGGVVALLIVIGIAAGGGNTPSANVPAPTTAAKTTATVKPVKPTKAAEPAAADIKKVTVAKVGDEFTVGDKDAFLSGKYTVLKGWTLSSQYGVPQLTARVRNADDDENALPNLQVKFLNGADLVMAFTCTANELEKGQTAKLNCFSSDDYSKAFKTITAETGM